MARPASRQPTDAELEILKILWDSGPIGLGEICTAIREIRPIATTTVATVLNVMLDKKQVTRRRGERGYAWQAKLSRDAATRGLTGELIDRIFDGSAHGVVTHLLQSGRLSESEVTEIQRLIDEHRQGDDA